MEWRPRYSLSGFGERSSVGSSDLAPDAEAAVGPVVVVLRPVLRVAPLGISEIDSVMLGQAHTSNAVVEALDCGVVGRFAGAAKVDAHMVPVAPVVQRDRCELGAVVHTEGGWPAVQTGGILDGIPTTRSTDDDWPPPRKRCCCVHVGRN